MRIRIRMRNPGEQHIGWPKNLMIILTHDTFRLSAWPGCKQTVTTVTRLVAEKPVIERKYQLQPRPADLHLLVGSWKLGGIVYVYVWLERSYDPPECHPVQQAYTFVIRLLSTFLTSVSIFSVSCCSRYVSLWNDLCISLFNSLSMNPDLKAVWDH